MYSAIIFLPLVAFLICGLFAPLIGRRLAAYLGCLLILIAAIFSVSAFFSLSLQSQAPVYSIKVMRFVHSGSLEADWGLRLDRLSSLMLMIVCVLSALIHLYCLGFLREDTNRSRFLAYLSLMSFFMLIIIGADDLIGLCFGWEGLGLSTYLIIGFQHQKPLVNSAALKLFIVDRIGDAFVLAGICCLYNALDEIELDVILENADLIGAQTVYLMGVQWHAMTLICLLFFIGAMTKSAQILAHVWLPASSAGLMPASAFIQTIGSLAAGLFLLVRLSPLFALTPSLFVFITIIGAISAVYCAIVACFQNDLRRVLAYSSSSQFGFMFVAFGLGAYGLAMLHLVAHAFFKMTLLLGGGSVIRALSGEVDMRRMGGLSRHMRLTYWLMVLSVLALTAIGIPGTSIGLSGFASVQAILASVSAMPVISSGFLRGSVFWMLVLSLFFTSLYSWRLIFMVFHGRERMGADVKANIKPGPFVMLACQFLLAIGSVLAGLILFGPFCGAESYAFWKGAIASIGTVSSAEVLRQSPFFLKILPLLFVGLGFLIAAFSYIVAPVFPKRLAERDYLLYRVFFNDSYLDAVSRFVFVIPFQILGRFFWKHCDEKAVVAFGQESIVSQQSRFFSLLGRLHDGFLPHYVLVMMAGLVLLLFYALLGGGIIQ